MSISVVPFRLGRRHEIVGTDAADPKSLFEQRYVLAKALFRLQRQRDGNSILLSDIGEIQACTDTDVKPGQVG